MPGAKPRLVPPDTRHKQARASDPAASAWVSANAGSGKTTVLVRRVLRLMLTGVDPSRILCLTYTTAAAANMANRLFDTLAAWSRHDDAALAANLSVLLDRAPTAAEQLRARCLFAEALETPGGLKIQTIHAFCTRVLQSAPFEAGIPAHFEVISETERQAAIEAAIDRTLRLAGDRAGDPDGAALKASLDLIAGAIDDQRFRALIDRALGASQFLFDADGQVRSGEAIKADIDEALAIDPAWTLQGLYRQAVSEVQQHVAMDDLAALFIAHGTARNRADWTQRQAAWRLASAGPDAGAATFGIWRTVLLTKEDQPRAKIATAGVLTADPSLDGRLAAAQQAISAGLDRINALNTGALSESLFGLMRLILADYAATKRRLALLDFGDLIIRTRDLFQNGNAAWLLYKLDAGLDHLLVDEAQDTSKDQWAILNALTSEFLAGEGQRDPRLARTIFAVGDEKQSIYGFQGAAPAEFGKQRSDLGRRVRDKGDTFHDTRLVVSFRSTRDVIEAVDAVFAQPDAFAGLSSDPSETATVHETVRADDCGAVDLWDLVEAEDRPDEEVWNLPVDTPERKAPLQEMARAIAETIHGWMRDGHDDLGQPFDPGDVLILMPRRKTAFGIVVRALKDAGVPVAGMDRLKLASHIAVEDLVALGRAVLLPDDDLTLAEVLKSPLFGLDDADLLRIAPGRTGSLRQALGASAHAHDRQAHDRLVAIEELACQLGPFAFYGHVLSVMGGRRLMLARLGAEAADAMDAFLARALDHEQREGPSLRRFLDAVEASSDDVKRDLATASGEVRVMTVHGAKGLEAGTVFIADVGMPPTRQNESPLLDLPLPGSNLDAAVTIWSPRGADDPPPVRQARLLRQTRAIEEHHRLLYVAMTRAENRLIVCGVRPLQAGSLPQSWYGMIESGLAGTQAGLERIAPAVSGIGRRRFKVTPARPSPETSPEPSPEAAPEKARAPSSPAPGWLTESLPQEVVVRPPLAPASALAAADLVLASSDEGAPSAILAAAAERGRLVHLLLQWLPSVSLAARPMVAARLAQRHLPGLPEVERSALVEQTLSVLDQPAMADLFGEGSLAEVEIGGDITTPAGPLAVAGRIDRLLVTANEIVLADFKTTRRPPREAAAIGERTLAQIATYRALLSELYPGRPIRALVIYTSGPVVLEAGAAQLDAALARVTDP
jgi:ATP-dependent helicase/nuclease subunit A